MAEVDYNQLKVAALKELLQERGLSSSGNKASLIYRLQDNDNVEPEDSVSRAHSTSSTSSRVRAAARKASAIAKLKLVDKKKHSLQLEQLNASRDLND